MAAIALGAGALMSCEVPASVQLKNKGSTYFVTSRIPVEAPVKNVCGSENSIHVKGYYCPKALIECKKFDDSRGVKICLEYNETSCLSAEKTYMEFCIDKFEWPNKKGELPLSWQTWRQSKALCESQGRRLCSDAEWTFACEGEAIKPYPYGDGLHRDHSACNTSKPWKDFNKTPRSQLYQGEPSGSFERCVSPFGVHDMPGNVDEWVVNSSGKPYISGLKGGHASFVRNACRPMTDGHNPDFSLYETGFRCCKDLN